MATNYSNSMYLRSLFGDLTPHGIGEEGVLPTGADAVSSGVLPAPLTTFDSPASTLPMTSPAARQPGMYESLKTPMMGKMDVGTFAQLAGMAAAAIGQDDRGHTTMGGRLGGMVANYAGQTMREGRAYDERFAERQEAMAEKRREFDQRQRESMAVRRATFAMNKSFSKADRLRMWNMAAPELGLPPLQQMGEEHDKTLKAIVGIYGDKTLSPDQKRSMALNRYVEDGIERGDVEPEKAIELLFPKQTLGGLQGMDEKGNPYYLDTQGRKVAGITPYHKPTVDYKSRGDVVDIYVDGKFQKTAPRGSLVQPKGNEPKPVTDEDRNRLMAAFNKATAEGRELTPAEQHLIGQMAERHGMEIKDAGAQGIGGRIKDKFGFGQNRYSLVPKQRAVQTPPPGYRNSGRTDVNGRQVWISADGKTAWVAD